MARATKKEPARTKTVESAWLISSFWKRTAFVALLVATALVYFQVGGHDFVDFDDSDYVTANPHVTSGLTVKGMGWALMTGHASNWHPLTWISHMVDYSLFRSWAGGHHLVSVGFHLANTALVAWVLTLMTASYWRSLMVTALFALHPLHVESVAWISERKDVLSTFFFLLTLCGYWRYTVAVSERGGRRWLYYVASLGAFGLGLLSKPMLVTVPFLLLLLDFWPLRRTLFSEERGRWKTLIAEKLPFLMLSVLSSTVTFIVQRKGGAVSTALSLTARIENAVVSYARYLRKTFWPNDLSVLYPHPGSWPALAVGGAALLLVVITVVVIRQWKARPYLAVGWFWFLGMMIPVIGLVQVGIQSMADRYTYIPMIGVFMGGVWLVADWWGSRNAIPAVWKPVAIGSVTICLICAACTYRQVQIWRTSETLFRQAVRVTKDNYLAYNNLGYFLSNEGNVEEALTNYAEALRINPLYEDALNNMGHALAKKKRNQEAIEYYERALRVRPEHVEVHNNLGNALSEVGRIDEAMRHYEFVLSRKPDHADAHNNYGIALAMKGRLDEAIGHFKQAIRFKKDYAGAHSNLGNAYAAQRKLDQAIEQYQSSLRINPKDAQAHNNLGNVLSEKGQAEGAIREYQKALELNADNPEAHFNLAVVLLRQGRKAEAINHCREALRLKPDYLEAQRQLQALTGSP